MQYASTETSDPRRCSFIVRSNDPQFPLWCSPVVTITENGDVTINRDFYEQQEQAQCGICRVCSGIRNAKYFVLFGTHRSVCAFHACGENELGENWGGGGGFEKSTAGFVPVLSTV
jgi:hypothetical protein